MDDAAACRFEQRTIRLPGVGRQVDQHLASRGSRAPQSLRHIRCGAAAESPHVIWRQLRVGHHHVNRLRRNVKLFGNDLCERRADVLTDLGLSRVDADLAVFADVKPCGDVPRSLASSASAPAAARLLLGMRRVHHVKDQNSSAQRSSRIRGDPARTGTRDPRKTRTAQVRFRDSIRRIPCLVHRRASFNILAAPETAARIRG